MTASSRPAAAPRSPEPALGAPTDDPAAPAAPTGRPCPTCGAVEAPVLTPSGLTALADAIHAAGGVR